jgi:hypothetical protein
MEVVTPGVREIWVQNSVDEPEDMSNTVAAVLKKDSLVAAYEAAMDDLTTDLYDKYARIELTEELIEEALYTATKNVFPFCALKTQNTKAVDDQEHEKSTQPAQ